MANEYELDPQKEKESEKKLSDDTKEWMDTLPKEQVKQLKDLTDKEKKAEIDKYLKENNGELDEKLEEKIEEIDQVLKKSPQIENTIAVYYEINNGNTAEPKDVLENPEYLFALTENDSLDADYVELIIPQGERLVSIGMENQSTGVIGRRDSQSEITEVSKIQNRKGDLVVRVKANLLPGTSSGLPADLTNKEAAKKWAEKTFKRWIDSLTPEQKQLLNDPSRIQLLNEQTELRRGNKFILDANARKDFEILEKSLESKYTKLSKPIYIYKSLQPSELGLLENSLYKENGKVDLEKYKDFQREFRYGMISNFMTASLSGSSGQIIFKVQVPKGTSLGYLSEDEVILSRGHGFEILESSIITDNQGKEHIKIEAKLVPKEMILQRIQIAEKTLNEQYQNLMKTTQKFISYDFTSFYASSMLSRADKVIRVFTQNVPNHIIAKCVEKMGGQGAFVLTDESLGNSFGKGSDASLGVYDPKLRQLFIRIDHMSHIETPGNDIITIIHEFGHAFDRLLWNSSSKTNKQLLDIYKKERQTITIEKYITSTVDEFFAGVFSYMYSPNSKQREQIQKEAPQACEFIQKLVDSMK